MKKMNILAIAMVIAAFALGACKKDAPKAEAKKPAAAATKKAAPAPKAEAKKAAPAALVRQPLLVAFAPPSPSRLETKAVAASPKMSFLFCC